jgi:hypothetical protein
MLGSLSVMPPLHQWLDEGNATPKHLRLSNLYGDVSPFYMYE